VSFPSYLFDRIVESHGQKLAERICLDSNKSAPITIRVNTLKTTRPGLLKQFEDKGYEVIPCTYSESGITFLKRTLFFSLEEFKEGLFEVQDEGSQLIASLIQAKPGQQVMDYCSGSGGKTLAFAPQMQNKGQIFLHDVRHLALEECRKRLRRAGIQNAQVIKPQDSKLELLKNQMHWVLVDAPCSGTGTLRRNPDLKWKLNKETLEELIKLQRSIFEKALLYLRPKGHIVYATCSLLKEENEDQVAYFAKTYGLELVGKPFASLPVEGGMDGFFGATLKRKE
jgi:16S rRNA C967 or C1407 C5-methylase (RsmB/RsmF family)